MQGLHRQHTWTIGQEGSINKSQLINLRNSKGSARCSQTCLLLSGRAFGIAAGQDGFSVAGGKLALRPQEAGHEEVEQRPELQDVVLRMN